MRVRVHLPDDGLRRAVAALLVEAGHEAVLEPVARPPFDLVIRLESGAPRPLLGTPTLSLRPGPGRTPDADPAGSLRRALTDGGEAVWAPPFDPRRFLSVLGAGPHGAPPGPDEQEGPGYPLLESSPDPWFLIDPAEDRVVWRNHAARQRGTLLAPEPGALPPGGADAVARPEGRRTLVLGGLPMLASWWTDARGRRVLGLVLTPQPARPHDEGNLRTLAEIGRVSATLAHEIRNPVASLASAFDRRPGALPAAERDEVAQMARERLAGMKQMLDDTLRLARPFRGPPQPVDLEGVMASALTLARSSAQFAGIDIVGGSHGDVPTVLGYAEPLVQALVNGLLNAAEAQGPRGRIVVEAVRDQDRAVLRVRDEGPGVPPDRRDRVFAPFYTTKAHGTGLGLAYVRRVAEACGGRVLFEDADVGGVLRIELPVAQEGRAAQ